MLPGEVRPEYVRVHRWPRLRDEPPAKLYTAGKLWLGCEKGADENVKTLQLAGTPRVDPPPTKGFSRAWELGSVLKRSRGRRDPMSSAL